MMPPSWSRVLMVVASTEGSYGTYTRPAPRWSSRYTRYSINLIPLPEKTLVSLDDALAPFSRGIQENALAEDISPPRPVFLGFLLQQYQFRKRLPNAKGSVNRFRHGYSISGGDYLKQLKKGVR